MIDHDVKCIFKNESQNFVGINYFKDSGNWFYLASGDVTALFLSMMANDIVPEKEGVASGTAIRTLRTAILHAHT